MSRMIYHFARAVANGRESKGAPTSREQLLFRLLHQRAEADRLKLVEQEKMLRNQILWSLPIRTPAEEVE